MLAGFQRIVENRILEAQRRGDFDNLSGSGKPLCFDQDASVHENLRLAYKILKNAGFVPPEVELRKQIMKTEEFLADMEETEAKYRALKKLNYMIMQHNILRGGSAALELPQVYEEKLVHRFGKKKSAK